MDVAPPRCLAGESFTPVVTLTVRRTDFTSWENRGGAAPVLASLALTWKRSGARPIGGAKPAFKSLGVKLQDILRLQDPEQQDLNC